MILKHEVYSDVSGPDPFSTIQMKKGHFKDNDNLGKTTIRGNVKCKGNVYYETNTGFRIELN